MKPHARTLLLAAALIVTNILLPRVFCALHLVERALSLSFVSAGITLIAASVMLLVRLGCVWVLPGWLLAELVLAVMDARARARTTRSPRR